VIHQRAVAADDARRARLARILQWTAFRGERCRAHAVEIGGMKALDVLGGEPALAREPAPARPVVEERLEAAIAAGGVEAAHDPVEAGPEVPEWRQPAAARAVACAVDVADTRAGVPGEGDDLARPPVDELGAELDGHGHLGLAQRVDAPAPALARLEEQRLETAGPQPPGGRETGGAGADDHHVGLRAHAVEYADARDRLSAGAPSM
jgi:hypothetical protein